MKRKKQKISLVGILLIIVGCLIVTGSFFAFYVSSKLGNYVYIDDEDDFQKINENLDGNYKIVTSEIRFTKPFVTIGSEDKPFTGFLEGNGCILYNLFFNNEEKSQKGMFGKNQGIIKSFKVWINERNFKPNSFSFLDGESFGFVTPKNEGTITSVSIQNDSTHILEWKINQSSKIGLITGENFGTIRHCYVNTALEIEAHSDSVFGLLCGISSESSLIERNKATISKISINSSSDFSFGSLVGTSSGAILKNNFISVNTFLSNCSNIKIGGAIGAIVETKKITSCEQMYVNFFLKSLSTNNLFLGGLIASALPNSFTVDGVIVNPNADIDSEASYGELLAFAGDESSIKRSFYTQDLNIIGSHYKNGEKKPVSSLTLEELKWDISFWKLENGNVVFKETY